MERRQFITLLGVAATAWPLASRAQQSAMPTVGFLNAASADGFQPMAAAFRRGLQEMGYVEGENLVIEFRWADNRADRLPGLVAELVHRQVAVIAATGTPAALAAKAETAAVPIVFESAADPLRLGLVASLSHPGGNVTGVTNLNAVVSSKRLELLHELLPTARVMVLLVNPTNPSLTEIETNGSLLAAHNLGVELHVLNVSSERDMEGAFAKLPQLGANGLVIGVDALFTSRIKLLGTLAARYKVPAVYENRDFVAAGGLLSYGGIITDSYQLTGAYVARILKGEKPADLPLTLSGRADEVIV